MFEIITINEKSPYLEEVIELGGVNSATLGFLPRAAFFEFAARKQILVAVDEKKNFLGYLLYGINRREILAYITHLCIEESQRGKGIAKALFDELKNLTKDTFRGIRIHCRRDYEVANKVWHGLGFTSIGEKPGRSKHGTTLTIWWFDHHKHPDLFTFADEQRTLSKLRVVIDANVFYDLQESPTFVNEQSHALLADWLQENIELCLTSEIFNEITREPDKAKREETRLFAYRFVKLSSPDDKFQKVREELRHFFPQPMSERDRSDLNQLARSIAAGIQFFVTRDEKLIKKTEQQIYRRFGMHIIRPPDLIIEQDALIRDTEYQPARLSGSRISINRVPPGQISFLEDTFRTTPKETKAKFRQQLLPYLADPHTFETTIVQDAEEPLALKVYGRQNQQELEIPIIRVVKSSLSATLARHLVLDTILISSREKRELIKVTEPCLSDDVIDALQENGFVFVDRVWVKVNLPVVGTAEELASKLTSLSQHFPKTSQYFQEMTTILNTAYSEGDRQTLLKVERSLWPAKITEINIPTFVVSIRPVWAMHLFDPGISKQDLFGGKPSLILKVENVYYRSSRTKILSAPARILWYVSRGAGEYQGTMSIRACSYLDEVVIDKPKTLFSRFRRLGVYQWKNVYEVAKRNIDQEIMAFRFSNTEVFSNPICRDNLQKIWMEETGKKFHIQNPISIPNQLFFRLYKIGFQNQQER